MATPPSNRRGDGHLRVSSQPVESEKLDQVSGGVIADIGLKQADFKTLTAESHIARAAAHDEATGILKNAAEIEHTLMERCSG